MATKFLPVSVEHAESQFVYIAIVSVARALLHLCLVLVVLNTERLTAALMGQAYLSLVLDSLHQEHPWSQQPICMLLFRGEGGNQFLVGTVANIEVL